MPKISLASARVNAKKTQEDVAKELGVSKTTINNWESGKATPRGDNLVKLSKLYKMPIEYLEI